MLKYRVVIIDEDESRQEKTFVGNDWRAKAMECARSHRWATIYSIS